MELRLPQWRTIVTAVLLVVLLTPAFRDGDGLPLSSYPMYATPRSATIDFIVPIGLDARGERVTLSTQQIAATRDPLIAESYLRDEVRAGRSAELCDAIAGRVQDQTAVIGIDVRREVHRVAEPSDEAAITQSESLAACEVRR